jgi:hypothetical protein
MFGYYLDRSDFMSLNPVVGKFSKLSLIVMVSTPVRMIAMMSPLKVYPQNGIVASLPSSQPFYTVSITITH